MGTHCAYCIPHLSLYSDQAKKTDRMKAAEASIKVLLENPTKKTTQLIQEAQAEYKGLYS